MRKFLSATLMAALTFMPLMDAPVAVAANQKASRSATSPPTTTPIKRLVVIFQENVSFDHYFGTYPYATNPAGEPQFTPFPNTPSVNGLTNALLTANPN